MSSGNGKSKALLAVRVATLVPLLWFLTVGLIGKFAGPDWVPIEAWAWPMMIAPVVLTVIFVKFRRIIQNPEHLGSLPILTKVAAGMFFIPNGSLIIFYSWVAVVPVVLCVAILLGGLIKRPVEEAL